MNSPDRNGSAEADDQWFVERSRDGSPEEFEHLVRRYERPLFAYLRGRVANPLEAEEAARDTFVRAFLSLKKLRKPNSFYAWLLGIAGRVTKERHRAAARRERNRANAESQPVAADATPEPVLEEAIAALPESCRQVILLRYYEGLSCQEAATRLGLPLGTVTKTLSRAYALLREELKARERAETTINRSEHHELR
jgi:RNA polymerase sigma-70 factor (ECF subfamily)